MPVKCKDHVGNMKLIRNPSITPSPALRRYIEERAEKYGESGATGRINDLFDRYQVMRKQLAISLTDDEKTIIRAMLRGVALNDAQFSIACMALQQDCFDDEHSEMSSINSLQDKLQAANLAQIMATIDLLGY